MPSKATEYLLLSLVTHKGGNSVALRSFGVVSVSGSFHVVPTFHIMFWLTNFSKNEFYVRFYYKVRHTLLKIGENFIAKQGRFFVLQGIDKILPVVLQSGAGGIKQQDRDYKIGQHLLLNGTPFITKQGSITKTNILFS